MELSRACSYGLFGMIYLARQPRGKIVSISEICQAQNLPEKFLAKIFQTLARAGLVRSHRGAGGGFSLARPANKIAVKELFESIQGPIYFVKCLSNAKDCERKEKCKLLKVWKRAQDYTMDMLTQTTLADLIK